MSGFSGGSGRAVGDLVRQVQGQRNAQSGQTPATAPPAGVGPGEPTQGGAYGQQGTYNTLATDMSRGQMGGYGFGGNQFSYQPFGNPYQQQSPFGGMFGGRPGGFMGGFGGMNNFTQPTAQPITGGSQVRDGFLNSIAQQIGHPGLRNRMQNAQNAYGGMMGNHQYTGGMGGGYAGQGPFTRPQAQPIMGGYGGYGKPQPMGGGFGGGGSFGRRMMY